MKPRLWTRWRLLASLAVIGLMWQSPGQWAHAQPVPPAPPAPPLPVPQEDRACKSRPKVCDALRRATAALGEAAREAGKIQGACTITIAYPACGTTPPVTYFGATESPEQVRQGRILLGWYLTNYTCPRLCSGRGNPAQCQKDCLDGRLQR